MRARPAAAKIQPYVTSGVVPRSAIWLAMLTVSSVQNPKARFRRLKNFDDTRGGTSSPMAADQETAPRLLASVAVPRISANTQCRDGSGRNGRVETNPHGSAVKMNVNTMIGCRAMLRRSQVARAGWTTLHRWGRAAMRPTAVLPHPSTETAKVITNGKLGIVRFSMGTLKHASMVEALRESSSSRWRRGFMRGPPWRAGRASLQHVESQDLAGFAVGNDLKGATANLAVRRETLGGQAGVDHQFEGLTAEGTLHRLGDFHANEGGTDGKTGQGRSRAFDATGRPDL